MSNTPPTVPQQPTVGHAAFYPEKEDQTADWKQRAEEYEKLCRKSVGVTDSALSTAGKAISIAECNKGKLTLLVSAISILSGILIFIGLGRLVARNQSS